MEELIIQLLKENGRVIIPEFGALIVKTKSPLKVIFNEFLQYNDGALIGATAKRENIEREDAAKRVKEFCAKINSDLDHGKTVSLGEIGVLSKSSTGKITLSEAGAAPGDSKSEPAKEAVDTKTTTVEFDLSEQKNDKPLTKAASSKPKTESKKAEPQKKEPVKTTIKEPIKTSPPVKKPIKKEEPVNKEPMPIEEYYENDKSKRRLNFILWAILIIVVNGAIIGFVFYDEEIKSIFSKNKTETEQPIDTPSITNDIEAQADTPAVKEELVIEDDIEEEVVSVNVSDEITGKKYYVVAGVFKDENNADNLVITLKNKGYNAEKFGKIGALHAVSYDVFPTKQEADQFMLKVKSEVDSEAWIKVVN